MSLIDDSAPSRAPPTHTLDCHILARAADNDREACRVLLRHVRTVITIIMGMRSPHLDDAVQVAFMHVHKVAGRFDPIRGQNAGPWVTRVTLREAAAFFRQFPYDNERSSTGIVTLDAHCEISAAISSGAHSTYVRTSKCSAAASPLVPLRPAPAA
jgi:hypothetical protein